MGAVLDILIVVIAGLTVFFAVKNGFVKTVLSAASFIISLIVAFTLVGTVRDAFLDSALAGSVREAVNASITSFVTDGGDTEGELPEFLTKLEFIGVDKTELEEKWNAWRQENTESLKTELVNFVSEPVIYSVSTLIAFLLLFIGTSLVLKILTYLLDRLTDLPVLRQANKALGLVAGVVLAVLRIYLFCAAVRLLIPCAETLEISLISSIRPENTFLFRLFCENNLFWYFFS